MGEGEVIKLPVNNLLLPVHSDVCCLLQLCFGLTWSDDKETRKTLSSSLFFNDSVMPRVDEGLPKNNNLPSFLSFRATPYIARCGEHSLPFRTTAGASESFSHCSLQLPVVLGYAFSTTLSQAPLWHRLRPFPCSSAQRRAAHTFIFLPVFLHFSGLKLDIS